MAFLVKPTTPAAPKIPSFLLQPMRLRPGCRLILQNFSGKPTYVLEDGNTGHFFQLGRREENLVRVLDGSRTGLEILDEFGEGGGDRLDRHQTVLLLSSLYRSGLLDGFPAPSPPPMSLFQKAIAKNPLFIRIPVGNPDPLLTRMERALRWLFYPWVVTLLIIVVLAAILAVTGDWQRFTDSAQSVLDADNRLWLFITFLGLKLVHESGHGLICKHFGGRIPEFGIYFMFFTPLTYVDATSSWAFPSRAVRILVSSGGMIAELLVASIAAIVWASTETGPLNTVAYNTIFSATVTTILFNANPLLRYDGYYILSDLTGMPNLYSRAGVAASGWFRRLVSGVRPENPEALWVGAYGLACIIWRLLLTLSICVGAIVLLHGVGILLAGLYLAGLTLPLLKKIATIPHARGKSFLRPATFIIAAGAALLIPIPQMITTPAVIQAASLTPIRVSCPGFLREILVSPGQSVEKGNVLARLDNPEETAHLHSANTLAKIAEVEAHRARIQRNPQLEAKKLEEVRALQSQAAEHEKYCHSLEIRAPSDGIIIGREISNFIGSFLPTGSELFAIGSANAHEVHILIPEDYAQAMQGKTGVSVQVFLPNQNRSIQAVLTRIEPQATRKIRFPEVTAGAGGPIPIRRQEQSGASKQAKMDESLGGMELVQPHFVAVAKLILPPQLLSGETCVVRLKSGQTEFFGIYLWHQFERLIRRYIARSDRNIK